MIRFLEDMDNHTASDEHHDDSTASTDKPWGEAIGAALLIQAVTLSGLVLVGFASCFQQLRSSGGAKQSKFWRYAMELAIPSFAAGALLATAVFLLIPEAFELLGGAGGHEDHSAHAEEESHEDEFEHEDHSEEAHSEDAHAGEGGGAAWKFGAALIGGFLFPVLLGALFPHHHRPVEEVPVVEHPDTLNSSEEVKDDEETTSKDVTPVKDAATEELVAVRTHNKPMAAGILVGDFFHNMADGFFLGSAFLLCSKNLAWTIVVATIYHELAQEIADFFLLTHHCGFSTLQALALNFASGLSVVIGVLIVFAFDVGNQAIGIILSVSSGVYLYIALVECLPRVIAFRKTARDTLFFLAFFVLGAVPIGLVLLNHVHCEAKESSAEHTEDESAVEEEGHEGHDHFRSLLANKGWS